MIAARIDSVIRISRPSAGFVVAFGPRASWPNPAWERAQKQRLRGRDRVPEAFSPVLEDERSGDILIPRGMLSAVIAAAESAGEGISWTARVAWNPTIPVRSMADVPRGAEARPYQVDATDRLIARRQGVIVLPCGGGKTRIGCYGLARLGQASLVVVPTEAIARQWVDAATGAGLRPRLLRGGSPDLSAVAPGEVAICRPEVLFEAGERPVDRFLAGIGVLVLDEVHHATIRSTSSIISRCPARWRWGLTATPDRADGFGFLIYALIGPELLRVSARALIDAGWLVRPAVIPVLVEVPDDPSFCRWRVTCSECKHEQIVSWEPWQSGKTRCGRRTGPGKRCGKALPTATATASRDAVAWSTIQTGMIAAPDVERAIVALLAFGHARRRRCLGLVPRISAATRLARLAEIATGAKVLAIDGEDTDADAKIERLASGEAWAAVATKLADEGLDVPELDLLVTAQSGRAKGTAAQRAGRVCRPAGADTPFVFDLVASPGVFRSQWRDRRESYRSEYGDGAIVAREPVRIDEAIALATRIIEEAS